MSYASKQSGFNGQISNSVGTNFITSAGSTLPIAPATLVSGTEYVIATTQLQAGFWMIEVQCDITGDATTSFEAIQIDLTNNLGTILFDNWLVGATLKSNAQIELNGTYPVFISNTSGAGNFSVKITPTFTGTAPTAGALIRPFKVV